MINNQTFYKYLAAGIVCNTLWPGVEEVVKRSLNDYSWSEISAISRAGNASTMFALGDTKNITLTTGEVVTMRIIGFNHDNLSDGSGKAGITFEMCNLLSTTHYMSSSSSYNAGWDDSALRSKLLPNGEIYNTLPSDVLDNIRPVAKITNADDAAHTLQTTEEYVFLLSEVEVAGAAIYSVAGEGTQYDYYKQYVSTSAQRIKKLANGSGEACWWWTRSPYYDAYSTNFCPITAVGNTGWSNAYSAGGVSFAFCV